MWLPLTLRPVRPPTLAPSPRLGLLSRVSATEVVSEVKRGNIKCHFINLQKVLRSFLWSKEPFSFMFIHRQQIDEFLGVNMCHQVSHLMFLERSKCLPVIWIHNYHSQCWQKLREIQSASWGSKLTSHGRQFDSDKHTLTGKTTDTAPVISHHHTPQTLPSNVLALHGLWIIYMYTQRHWQMWVYFASQKERVHTATTILRVTVALKLQELSKDSGAVLVVNQDDCANNNDRSTVTKEQMFIICESFWQ